MTHPPESPTDYTVELARRAISTYGLDGSPTIHYPPTMTSDERVDDLYRRRILDAVTVGVIGQLLAPVDGPPAPVESYTGAVAPDPFARSETNHCPAVDCPADHYPHDPDDYGHANPCGCDWSYTCAFHAELYRAAGIMPGELPDRPGYYIGPDEVEYPVSDPAPDARCAPCRAGRHARCLVIAGDCTNVCHPLPSTDPGDRLMLCQDCHHSADHIDRREGCEVCDRLADIGRYAPCATVPQVVEPEDDIDGMAAELAALVADRLEANTGPGFAGARADGLYWAVALRSAPWARRAAIRKSSWTPRDLAAMAAASGLVPGLVPAAFDGGDDGTGPARGIELASVWSGLLAQAEGARLYVYTTDNGDGTDSADEPSFDGWRGDRQAAYDASTERYNLSRSGAWSDYWRLPPVYRAGADSMTHGEWSRWLHDTHYPTTGRTD